MSIDLLATLRLRDDFTSPLRRVTQQMSNLGRLSSSVTSSVGSLTSSIGRQANELTGLKSQIAGVAGAYLGAQGAMKAFNATIGAAATYQQSEVAIKAIFNDDEASSAYLALVEKMAIDSPLLNSGEMLNSSKSLVAMTKDVDELGKAWSIAERLMVLAPEQGTDGAVFSLKEMLQGDSLSMVERFGLNKGELNVIKKMDIPSQLSAISSMLDGMGITQSTVEAMGNTTLGYWAQIGERTSKFMRDIGNMGNSKIGEVLGGIVTKLDSINLDALAVKFDAVIGNSVQNVIDFAKKAWEMREPILAAAKVVGTFVGAVVGIVVVAKTIMGIGAAIAFFASPIGLLATGITAAAFGFKELNAHSDKFREMLDNISDKIAPFKDKVTTVFDGIKVALGFEVKAPQMPKMAGDTGVMMLDEGNQTPQSVEYLSVAEQITKAFEKVKTAVAPVLDSVSSGFAKVKEFAGTAVDFLKTKFTELQPSLAPLAAIFTQVWGTVSSVFSSAWSIISPILSGLWSLLQIVGEYSVIMFNNVLVPALGLAAQAFSTLWSIASPILQLVALGFEIIMAAVKALWENALAPFVNFLTTGVKNAFESLGEGLAYVQEGFDFLSSKVSTVYDKIRDFAGMISNIKLPDWVTSGVSTVVKTVGNFIGAGNGDKADGSHYNGLLRVSRDGYMATLHKDETVLPRFEADAYRSLLDNGGSLSALANGFMPQQSQSQASPNDSMFSGMFGNIASALSALKPQAASDTEVNVNVNSTMPAVNVSAAAPNLDSLVASISGISAASNVVTNDYSSAVTQSNVSNVTESILPQLNFEPITTAFNALVDVFKSKLGGATGVTNVDSGVSNVTYDNSASVTNQYSYATYMAEQKATATQQTQQTQAPSLSVQIAKLADHIVVREDADIDRIADGIVSRIIENRGGS